MEDPGSKTGCFCQFQVFYLRSSWPIKSRSAHNPANIVLQRKSAVTTTCLTNSGRRELKASKNAEQSGLYDVKMAMWLSSVVQYLPSLGAVQLDSAREVIISQKPAKFSFPYRIARHLHISVDAHETSLGLNSHSNHDHNPSLPIADPSVQKIDSTDSIGSQPSCQYGSKATLTKEATSVCPPASTKSGTGDGENSASVETVEKGSLILQTCHTVRLIILSSWVNWALLFVPVGITLGVVHRIMGHKSPISPTVVFSINAVAIVPLASLLGFATENAARNLSDTTGALLNVTFGNAVELIILKKSG
ncbi:conserved hypothetical protein [Histoplasma capsulatum H143]|uniref:Sodium/calcium exchanger membrane region domain-containing protein n=1 Tax=Ajellomyces capsulatus (strain H143) TaxID=544712 RepID=C6H3T8_AJECH|nr:conserved hypothetical protein [Histoplasma capsulatum H143]